MRRNCNNSVQQYPLRVDYIYRYPRRRPYRKSYGSEGQDDTNAATRSAIQRSRRRRFRARRNTDFFRLRTDNTRFGDRQRSAIFSFYKFYRPTRHSDRNDNTCGFACCSRQAAQDNQPAPCSFPRSLCNNTYSACAFRRSDCRRHYLQPDMVDSVGLRSFRRRIRIHVRHTGRRC